MALPHTGLDFAFFFRTKIDLTKFSISQWNLVWDGNSGKIKIHKKSQIAKQFSGMTGHAMQCIQWGRCRDDFSQKPVHKVLAGLQKLTSAHIYC